MKETNVIYKRSSVKQLALPGVVRITQLKIITGIQKANCLTCTCGYQEHDGDYGEIYCGMVCDKLEGSDHTYVEDTGLSLEAEKTCWEPEFWHSVHFTNLIDGEDVDTDFQKECDAVVAAFRAAVDSFPSTIPVLV